MRTSKNLLTTTLLMLAIIGLGAFNYSMMPGDGEEYDLDMLFEIEVQPISDFVQGGIDWLIAAQYENGGWGAGMHARQDIRDPHAVSVDPGTTAFAAMALLRSGHTPNSGKYSSNLNKSLELLLNIVEKSPKETPNITTLTGTQPQRKLGYNIDVTLTAQFLTRVNTHFDEGSAMRDRIGDALTVCLTKIQISQSSNGSWASGGWAPVLQSVMANNALEGAYDMGYSVDTVVLAKSREYQQSNIDAVSGSVTTESAAGVQLYSISSTGRASAKEARKAAKVVVEAKKNGKVDKDAKIDKIALMDAGMSEDEAEELAEAYTINQKTVAKLKDDNVMRGFGNNGGEEFLSHMMTSESLVVTGGKEWRDWNNDMHELMKKIQNPDGSWNGHHCITSPVFCTAAVILTLTTDRDVDFLTAERSE